MYPIAVAVSQLRLVWSAYASWNSSVCVWPKKRAAIVAS